MKAIRQSLTLQILLAMTIGICVGLFFGPQSEPLGNLGKLVIQLIKALAVPLVFFAISEAVVSTHIPKRRILRLFFIVGINAIVAISIALLLTNSLRPGDSLRHLALTKEDKPVTPEGPKEITAFSVVSGFIPESVIQPFLQNNVAGIVILALLVGVSGRSLKEQQQAALQSALSIGLALFQKILLWLVYLVPLAVFGVTAKTIGEHGFAPLRGLGAYLLVCLSGLTLQALLVYQVWIKFVARRPLGAFWKEVRPTLIYAFGTNSSLATLPLTLANLDRLQVSKSASRLGACIGTNLNNDGILLYEAAAALMVAQAAGIDLSVPQQIFTCFLCVIAAIGVAGVPEAGIISLSLVLATVGLPTELLPLLLTVDWIVARGRSVVNTLADMSVSIALDCDETSNEVELIGEPALM